MMDSKDSWGAVTRSLHWVMAILFIGILGVGFFMVEFESDLVRRFKLTQLHKSFGFVAFIAGLLRIAWQLVQTAHPKPPETMKKWEQHAARTSHLTFYVLMLALPVSGWLMATASPLNDVDAFPFRVPNMVFGLFELPDPFKHGSAALSNLLLKVHFGMALGLTGLLVVHIGATLKHVFVDKDDVLRRMLLGGKSR